MFISRLRSGGSRSRLAACVLLVIALVAAPAAFTQVTTAAIHGTATDASGAVVARATVTALDTATGISTVVTTNTNGFYTFPSLQIGPYTVTVEAAGFEKFQSTDITLVVNANLEVNARLTVGGSMQTVTVSAGGSQVETANTQLEQEVPESQIANLPMLGRDAASLEKLVPGVVESSDRFGSYSANGSQTTNNSFLLDGIDNNDGPLQSEGLSINPDALAEENIITSTLNPEFARNSGAVVNQIIKNGTNSIHGSAFEFYRDTFLNNGDYFSPSRPPFHQNLFGATLGAPVIKNRLFAFLAYQGTRNNTGQTAPQVPVFQSGILPSGSAPGGDFSNENNLPNNGPNGAVGLSANPIPFSITTGAGTAHPGVACGPGTPYTLWTDCFPAGTPVVIAPSSFNAIALKLAQQYVPAANAGTALAPLYAFNQTTSGVADQGILRADYHVSQKDALFATGIFQSSPSSSNLSFGGSDLPGFGAVQAEHFKLFAGSWTHTFSPSMLNELRGGLYRFNFAAVEPAQVVTPASLGFQVSPNNPASGIPLISLDGLFSLGFSNEGPQPRIDTNLSGSDSLTWVFHNHSFKLGAQFEQFLVQNPYAADNNGDYGYSGKGLYSSGDPGIDFLLGIPDTYQQSSGGFTDTRAWEYYAYAQDSWRATSDLTVNYGIAWDVETPNANAQFKGEGITCFALGNQTSNVFTGGFAGLLFPGDPGCNRMGGASTKFNHFGPRIGIAWSPSSGPSALIGDPGAHRMSVRMGFGIYYNRDQEEGQLQNLGDTPNYKASQGAADFGGSPGFANPFADVAGGGSEPNPFPFAPPAPGSALDWSQYVEQDTSSIARNYAVPYSYNFNLNIQRQFGPSMTLQIGYVGSIGRKLATAYEADPITKAGHDACVADPACDNIQELPRLHLDYPQYAAQPTVFDGEPAYLSMGQLGTTGASSYHALQVSVRQNLWHNLFFNLSYTYSHSLDDSSGLESSGFNGGGLNIFPGFQYLSYGSSDFDARHRFVISYDYALPLLASMNRQAVVKTALGDWHVAGVTVFQTGFPVSISDAGAFTSGYCDQYSYYSCPDVPVTTQFKFSSENLRKTFQASGAATWFDSSPFSAEPLGSFGNVARGLIHGPGFNYTNLSLFKYFPVGGEGARKIQLMIQASNAFNHANFDNPDGNFNDGPLFGTVTQVRHSADFNTDPTPGRTVQLVGRFVF